MIDVEKRFGNLRGSNGKLKTASLFWENRFQSADKEFPFTLTDFDRSETCKSMYQIFMQHETEYDAAMALLGSWRHWEALCKAKFFKPYIQSWRQEVILREESMAKKVLLAEARDEANVTAAKAILAENKKTASRGRPSKQEKAQRLDADIEMDEFLEKSMKLIKK